MILKFNSWTHVMFSHTVLQFLKSKEKHSAWDHKFEDIHQKVETTGQEIESKLSKTVSMCYTTRLKSIGHAN